MYESVQELAASIQLKNTAGHADKGLSVYKGGQESYHEGVLGEEVPAGYSGCPGWRVGVRSGRPSTEPTTDGPDYEDSGRTHENVLVNKESKSKICQEKTRRKETKKRGNVLIFKCICK